MGTNFNMERKENAAEGVVFVDSLVALQKAKFDVEPEELEIRTTAPSLIFDPRFKTHIPENLELEKSENRMGRGVLRFCQSLYDRFLEEAEYSALAIIASRVGLIFPTVVQKAMFLEENDFYRPVSVVRVSEGSISGHQTNMPWSELLESNPNLRILEVPAEGLPNINRRPAESVGFWDRQKLGGYEKIGFQLADRFCRYLPSSWSKGDFLLARHNLLLRETALALVAMRYRIWSLEERIPDPEVVSEQELGTIRAMVETIVREFLEPVVVANVIPSLIDIFLTQLVEAIGRYRSSAEYWRTILSASSDKNFKAVLTNILPISHFAALHTACQEHGLPLIAFQHGVGREISTTGWTIQSTYEGNTADYFYSFNHEAAQISSASHFNKAKNIAAGLPAAYWRCDNYRKPASATPPLIFVSTKLYRGNVNYTVGASTNDYRMAEEEWEIVKNVFSRLPYDLLYKPYPNARYLDEDPVVEKISSYPNISVYEFSDDLSFLLPDCRVVIAARATSTIAWCATSGKPFVFIDIPWDKPLRPEARQQFEKAFFVFDASAENFQAELREFLSQPLPDIERKWNEKAGPRRDVIETFFGAGGIGAGTRAAHHIVNNVIT